MIAIQKVDLHLDRPREKLRIVGVQGDVFTRGVRFLVHMNHREWKIPENVQIAIWYLKKDGTGGMYDTLPDGESAWEAEGNALTVYLVPQMLAAAGDVTVQLEMKSGEAVLHSFEFTLEVARCLPLAKGSRNYFRWQHAFVPQTVGAESGQLLRIDAVDEQGRVIAASGVPMENAGEDGATFYPTVSAAGDLSWTNDQGLVNPKTVNIMGPAGPQGPQGIQGQTGPRGADGAQGVPGLNWRGAWEPNMLYGQGDAVTHGGYVYVCTADSLPDDLEPGTSEGDWSMLAEPGTDGHTPVKGVDYWTEEEQTAMVNAVLANFTNVAEVGS